MANESSFKNPYFGLRKIALEVSASDLGVNVSDDEPYGIIMETGYPKATVTLLSLADGTTSLYFSNAGGIIGAGRHANIRSESMNFVSAAKEFMNQMEKTAAYPLPDMGQVRFLSSDAFRDIHLPSFGE